MPISDYESEDKEFASIPDGLHTAVIDNATGEIKDGKVKLKVRYRITEGEFKKFWMFKDYLISEKTCEKFLPWQFGVMGIWKEVRDAKDFEQGLEKAIDAIGKLMETNCHYDIEATNEDYEYNGKSGVRLNVILSANLGARDASAADTDNSKPDFGSEPSFDSSDEIPF